MPENCSLQNFRSLSLHLSRHVRVQVRCRAEVRVAQKVLRQATHLHQKRAKLLTCALRSFLRYARYRGDLKLDLAAAVPVVPNWSMPSIPRGIGMEQVRHLLASINRRTAVGRRDYAILLLLARLGLRSSEIVFLDLEAIDWKAGLLNLRGKGGRQYQRPLPKDVGKAIVAYLQHRRPHNTSRRVFLRSRPPICGFFGQGGIGSLVRHSIIRAGIVSPSKGAHQFRHGLATQMLRNGASLIEIGNVQPSHWARRLAYVRGFALYRSATDSRTQIPAQGLLPFHPKRARPYLYSDAQVGDLLHAALKLRYCYESGKLRPWVYYCFFGLLSVTGLRVSEAQNLEVQDVDLKAAVLTIRCAQFGKTRLVPLHSSTCRILAKYLDRRRRHWGQRPVSSYLFITSQGHRLDGADIRNTFYALSRQTGLRGPFDSHGPRLHDFRHRFATRALLHWYQSNQDPERKLPLLSAFLGHVHIAGTQWYLRGTPELMREAMCRLEHRWEDRP